MGEGEHTQQDVVDAISGARPIDVRYSLEALQRCLVVLRHLRHTIRAIQVPVHADTRPRQCRLRTLLGLCSGQGTHITAWPPVTAELMT